MSLKTEFIEKLMDEQLASVPTGEESNTGDTIVMDELCRELARARIQDWEILNPQS